MHLTDDDLAELRKQTSQSIFHYRNVPRLESLIDDYIMLKKWKGAATIRQLNADVALLQKENDRLKERLKMLEPFAPCAQKYEGDKEILTISFSVPRECVEKAVVESEDFLLYEAKRVISELLSVTDDLAGES